jgi:hypothetical protein
MIEVLYRTIFDVWCRDPLLFAIIFELRHSRQLSPTSWDLGYILFALLVSSFLGYLWANWKWKDYERMSKR